MKDSIKKILLSPVTHFNVLLVGLFCLIQTIHLQHHHNIDADTHSYVKNFMRRNPNFDWEVD